MSKQTTGLKRSTVDKYYTQPQIVNECMKQIQKYIEVNPDDICIEPSSGNGAFIEPIKKIFTDYLFYDIEPEHDDIIEQDFLEFDYTPYIGESFGKIHIIGNPPFGRQSSLAIKFIKYACLFCDSVSFILPKSFKKDSMKKKFPLDFHLKYEWDIPDNSFLVDNKIHNVPCVFQIWKREKTNRVVAEKLLPKHFTFVKKTETHDISFRRVGVYAGEMDRDTSNKSIQSHYFIKFDIPLTDELFESLKNIEYSSKNHTVGPKSISKQELIKEFNMVI